MPGAASTSAAIAPPAAAWGRKSSALKRSPLSATNSDDGSIRRVSVHTALISAASFGTTDSSFPETACRTC
jgi:hypothetical protein